MLLYQSQTLQSTVLVDYKNQLFAYRVATAIGVGWTDLIDLTGETVSSAPQSKDGSWQKAFERMKDWWSNEYDAGQQRESKISDIINSLSLSTN